MADQKPPRFAGDERATLLALWQYHRDSLVRKVEDVDDDDARHSDLASGTSLLWLVNHLCVAETLWVLQRFAADDLAAPQGATIAEAVAAYRATWQRVDAVVARHDLDDLCRGLDDGGPPANLRWVVTHLLEETARHAGHADILRERIDGATGR